MRYLLRYSLFESSDIPQKVFNEYCNIVQPYIDCFVKYFDLKLLYTSTLEMFIDMYNSKTFDPIFEVNLSTDSYTSESSIDVNIKLSDTKIEITSDSLKKPLITLITRKLIRKECLFNKTFINLVKNDKNNGYYIDFRINHGDNLFIDNIDLYSISKCLNTPIKKYDDWCRLLPFIIKFGTDDEIKRFWSEVNDIDKFKMIKLLKSDANNYKSPKNIKENPDCRGFYDRLKSIIDVDFNTGKDMGEMGF